MSILDRNLSAEDVIRISLASAPGGTGQVRNNELAASFIMLGLKLAGFAIVPAEGGAASAAERDAGTGAESAASRSSSVPMVKREIWPKICNKCHKTKNDRAHADECDDTACPL